MKHIQIVACAAPPVLEIGDLVARCKSEGMLVSAVLTPSAAKWIDVKELSLTYGVTVRSHYRHPSEPRPSEPPPNLILVAPATFNTLNKWALGIADTLAISILCEGLGAGIPTRVVPCMTEALRNHPASEDSIKRLKYYGVVFLDSQRIKFRGSDGILRFDWGEISLS